MSKSSSFVFYYLCNTILNLFLFKFESRLKIFELGDRLSLAFNFKIESLAYTNVRDSYLSTIIPMHFNLSVKSLIIFEYECHLEIEPEKTTKILFSEIFKSSLPKTLLL